LLCYPPHTTHALQGLDVVIFSQIKTNWSKKLRKMSRMDEKVTKRNFICAYSEVREAGLSVSNVLAAWKATGIWPFNPNVIEPEQLAPARLSSTEASMPIAALPKDLEDVRDALKLRHARREDVFTEGFQVAIESTPTRVSGHIDRAVDGTAYQFISNPAINSFNSSVPVPELTMTPVHHRNPNHPHFFLPPSDVNSLSGDDARHYLKLAIQHITHQSDKIDKMETALFCCHQYAEAAQKTMYRKEQSKKKKSGTEVLAAKGNRALTSDEWIQALEDEANEKASHEQLVADYNKWKEEELKGRKSKYEEQLKEYETYRKKFLKDHPTRKRPDKPKPKLDTKRPETPQRFWKLRKNRNKQGAAAEVEDDDEDGWESEA
jgi:hypothetical protein